MINMDNFLQDNAARNNYTNWHYWSKPSNTLLFIIFKSSLRNVKSLIFLNLSSTCLRAHSPVMNDISAARFLPVHSHLSNCEQLLAAIVEFWVELEKIVKLEETVIDLTIFMWPKISQIHICAINAVINTTQPMTIARRSNDVSYFSRYLSEALQIFTS